MAVNASLWTRIHEMAEGIEHDHLFLVRVQAHRKIHSSHDRDTRLRMIGNSYADTGAKWAGKFHPGDERQRRALSQFRSSY